MVGSDGSNKVLVDENSGTTTPREMMELQNNGGTILILDDSSVAQRWSFGTSGANFVIDEQANGGTEFSLSNTGNLTITGIYSPSDRNLKDNIVPVSGSELLAKLAAVPVSFWSYKTDPVVRHVGPMAQDFSAAFGLGINDTTISPNDMAGLSLAAVQALQAEVAVKDQKIQTLEERLAALEAAFAALSK